MTTDMPSSDELIRRAKETLHLEKDDFLPRVDEELADMGVSMGEARFPVDDVTPGESRSVVPSGTTRSTGYAESARTRRASTPVREHPDTDSWSAGTSPVPVPASPFHTGTLSGSGRWMRIVGSILLGIVAVIWVLLLIGLIDSPEGAGEVIGGGLVTTFIPFLIGLVLRRAGKRRATAV